jgi:signal transduction histidine kinase
VHPKRYLASLRFKITAGIALPLLVILSAFSYIQYLRQRELLLSNLDRTTTNLSNVISGSLQHAMLTQDWDEVQGIMANIAVQEGIRGVFIMNRTSRVRFSPDASLVGLQYNLNDEGCIECHSPQRSVHPYSEVFTNAQGERIFRNCNPIKNRPECQRCHDAGDPFNGVLITDLSMKPIDALLTQDLQTNILWSAGAMLATILALNTLMSRLVVTRVERLVEAIKHFARGDLAQRVLVKDNDEIGELGASFNQMAEGLDQKAELERKDAERAQELKRLYEELRQKEALRGQLLDKVITAQEEERKRIARDLHDQLGQALSALTMGMDAAESALPSGLDEVKQRIGKSKSLATRALDQTHALILGLRPIVLDDLGLVSAIRAHAQEHLEVRGIPVQVEVRGTPVRLPPDLEITLFRIVQEAISNIAKYANARHVNIRLEFAESTVEVSVQDDGVGFDPSSVLRGEDDRGLGLLGMQERATLAEGTFELESQPGQGVRLTVKIPLTKYNRP